MPAHILTGSLTARRLLTLLAFTLAFGACAHKQQAQAPTRPDDRDGFFEPEPGREDDFFRAVDVLITVDFDKPSIEVEPFDPFCPDDPEAERAGKCNIVRFEAPIKPYGQGMQAGAEDTLAFAEDLLQGDRATETYRLPRIFYPPTSTGENSTQTASGCRPDFPARQYRWVVLCKDGTNKCLGRDDQVIIRPKVSDSLSACAVSLDYPVPNFVILDRLAAYLPEYNCLRDFTAPPMSDTSGQERRDRDALRTDMASEGFQDYMRKHNAHFAAKARIDRAQAKTLFSPQTSGTLSITAACLPEQSQCPGCCRGSVTSGIPYRPRFLKPGSGIMWDYEIELWRNRECIAELDPPGWVEDDSGPPSGGQGG